MKKPPLVGLNHVALEVDSVDDALEFYSAVFAFELRGAHKGEDGVLEMAFLDMGDQFLALSRERHQAPDRNRHFGLVVDDRSSVRDLAAAAGATILDTDFLDFLDSWGKRIEVVEYRALQFTKAEGVLRSMGLTLEKSAEAVAEINKNGMV
ncbi:VOC family protein [Rhizobium sp. S96]|uniref:VOC family protein n=1 Tax=Rhizobium sp. S96 TaxID=3055140 RepID=UPI0025AAFFF2|nr:VOC family protein [Rhizobium sp. S96]MDM9621110.1 VOC family protein [Rhizobium sp. S96]